MKNLYENLNLDNFILDDKYGVILPICKNWKKIGINLSGGADSAMMTWILCQTIIKYNLDITIDIITFNRNYILKPWQGFYSLRVYNWFKDHFNKIISKRIEGFVPPELEHCEIPNLLNGRSGDQIIIESFNEYLISSKKIDAVYNATTKSPPIEGGMPNRYCDPELQDLINKKLTEFNSFKGITKDHIIKIYYDYNLHELLDLTRSCEVNINNLDFDEYKEGTLVPTCNTLENSENQKCWWCKERNWAINIVKNL